MRRALRTAALVGGAAFALVFGCSLVIGIPDRGAAPTDASSSDGDATFDSLPVDVAIDSIIAIDGSDAHLPFCRANPGSFFCDDFEKGALSGWTGVVADAGAEVRVVTDDPAPPDQPGHSLLVDYAADAAAPMSATAFKDIPSTANLVVAFDVYVDRPVATGALYFFRLDAPPHRLDLLCTASSCDLQEWFPSDAGPGYMDHTFTTSIAIAEYVHVQLELNFVAGGSSATVIFGGVRLLVDTPLDSTWRPTSTSMSVGLPVVPAHVEERKVHVDNVVVTTG